MGGQKASGYTGSVPWWAGVPPHNPRWGSPSPRSAAWSYFKNHKRPVIEIIKENAVTFERQANVPFQVWYASNNTSTGELNDLGTFYTDENGRIELNGPEMGELGLRDGWFRVKELEPLKGFAIAAPTPRRRSWLPDRDIPSCSGTGL